ncbi:DUF5006 domain-containing protein [uncultured Bacteroides sp.]|uniref:DUF5006 domain-containing protein n=1 Tax=uncultured Bacteroides sp. TaxID=162156 RepID=UPI0025F8C97C|nr:DUF5006 domain-containing protein [uncultured Bacteroides sp.]
MIKRILYRFLPVCLLIIGFVGCKDDDAELALPKTVPLKVEANATSFVMGEKMVLTVKVFDAKNPELVSNEDFDVYLTAKDGEKDVSKTLFKSFPSMVTFPKGEKSMDIELPIIDNGLEPKAKLYVNVISFVRGYTMTDPTVPIVVSDHHYTVVSLKNNSDNTINEGETFTVQAQAPVAVTSDMDINITIPEDQKRFYESPLPIKLTLKAGAKSGEVTFRTIHNPELTQDEKLTLNFSTVEDVLYPLDNEKIEVTMKEIDVMGTKLLDERWVYEHPAIPFASSDNYKAKVDELYGLQSVKMQEMNEHPNADLAAAGWKFYNAWEFHGISVSPPMWSDNNTWNNKVPQFLAARNTVIAQNHAAIINTQFSNITDEGYLRMIQMKVPSTATAPASGARDYGTAAFYACGTGSAWASNNQLILEGCRMEIRARFRGERNGFNMGMWLISDEAGTQQYYSEIDILENPVGSAAGNKAHQTFHGKPAGATEKSSKTANREIEMGDWNIYWLEWRSGEELAMGINGEETVCLKKSEWKEEDWTFTNEKNPKGLKFILTMGAPSPWALGESNGTTINGVWTANPGWDTGFANFTNYDQDRDNPAIPRMEIDWIRTYINKTSKSEYEGGRTRNGNKYY